MAACKPSEKETKVNTPDQLSDFVNQLSAEGRKRYVRKLDEIGFCDPKMLPKSVTKSIMESQSLPSLGFPHIYMYPIVTTPSPYTGQEHKAHKSMQAMDYVTSGKVTEIRVWKQADKSDPTTCVYVLLSKVMNAVSFLKGNDIDF